MFTENQHLVGFSPIMKVSFQRTKREDFYTHYFIRVLAYVVISRHFLLKSITWRLSWKTIIRQILLIRVLNHFYSPSYEDFSILTRESNDIKLKIMESFLIVRINLVLTNLALIYNISGYHMFYHIIWCSFYHIVHIELSFVQFSLLCYDFCILSKTEYMSISS